jgi:hypothetical protein
MNYLDENKELITGLARELVSNTAPQEIPLFRTISENYFMNPEKPLGSSKSKDELLGFGYGEAVAYATPVILSVAASVITFLYEEVKKSVKDEGATVIKEQVKRLFKIFRSPENSGNSEKKTSIIITSVQVDEIRQLAFERARQLNLPEKDAHQLVDLLVQNLNY